MIKSRIPLLLLILLTSLSFCSTPESEEALPAFTGTDITVASETEEVTEEAKPETESAKVVKIAKLRFQVDNVERSMQRVEAQLSEYNAFVFNSSQLNKQEATEVDYTIKVAPAQLERLLKALQQESVQLDIRQISSRDVTTEYVDVTARIKVKQSVEQRYNELLKQAVKIADVLAIEAEIKKVREEREVMQARLNALQHETAYSTIHLSMYQLIPFSMSENQPNFFAQALAAVVSGWELCRNLMLGLLHVWPLWVFGAVAFWFYRRYNRQRSTAI